MSSKRKTREIKPAKQPTGRKRPVYDVREQKRGAERLGRLKDKSDYNPKFCMAQNRRGEQCGKHPLKGRSVCGIHGPGYPKRVKEGRRLSPEMRPIMSGTSTVVNTPEDVLEELFQRFPELAEREQFYKQHPGEMDLAHNAARLQALSDWIMCRHDKIKPDLLVRQQTAILTSKAAVDRTRAQIEARRMVPMEVVRKYVCAVGELFSRFVPREHHEAFARELRLLALSGDAEVVPGQERGDGAGAKER